MDDLRGVVTRVGDETVGEMWSLYDGQDVLNEVDPTFAENIRRHVRRTALADPFHVSANTDPKGDRSKRPQDQDPDMLLHVVRETDAGIVVRGAKYETAAAYANQAFVKPTIANWGESELSDYAVGFICDLGSPGPEVHLPLGLRRAPSTRGLPAAEPGFDEVDALVIFDDVEVPWENVLFYRHTRAAAFIRATLHRYSAFAYTQRVIAPGRPADRRGAAQRAADRPREAAGGAGEAGRARLLPRGHQRAPDRGDRAWRSRARRPADAEPVAALHGPRAGLERAAAGDAPRARAVRRPDLRHADAATFRDPEVGPVAGEVLHRQRAAGRPRTAAACWPSRATSSTPTGPGTG